MAMLAVSVRGCNQHTLGQLFHWHTRERTAAPCPAWVVLKCPGDQSVWHHPAVSHISDHSSGLSNEAGKLLISCSLQGSVPECGYAMSHGQLLCRLHVDEISDYATELYCCNAVAHMPSVHQSIVPDSYSYE